MSVSMQYTAAVMSLAPPTARSTAGAASAAGSPSASTGTDTDASNPDEYPGFDDCFNWAFSSKNKSDCNTDCQALGYDYGRVSMTRDPCTAICTCDGFAGVDASEIQAAGGDEDLFGYVAWVWTKPLDKNKLGDFNVPGWLSGSGPATA